MDYYVSPSCFTSVFTVPTAVADRYLRLAKAEHIKVILYIMRNMAEEISVEDIAKCCDIEEYDVKEALLYWADAGILMPKEAKETKKEEKKKTVSRNAKPSRADAARRGLEDEKIRYLLSATQLKLGRNLKSNETETLVWLYDDEGLDVSLILLIIQYAVEHKKANIRFIESVAVDWVNKGIDNITDADEELRRMALGEQSWSVVSACFGIERRKPSAKETDLSLKWLEEWKFSKEMLIAAYEECVNNKSKFSMAYTAKILEIWHEKGYKTPEDIEDKPKKDNSNSSYDLDLYERMLNSKD